MRFFVLPLLLAAAAVNAEVFHFAGQHGQASTVYEVHGAVTVGVHQLTGEKAALEYNGTLAVQQTHEGEFLATFTNFTVGKYDKVYRDVNDETFGDLTPEEQRHVKVVLEHGGYETEMQKPVKFHMKDGQVVRMEAGKDHQQWSLNVFRSVFTVLQNQVRKPTNLALPHVEYKYEDGVTGNCKVQYHVFSHPTHGHVEGVYNLTKTTNYKDCFGRPVYVHLKDAKRGCAGVCDNHHPDNFLGQYEEEYTDFETKPTPGCPVHQQRTDTLVTVQTVTKYNVSNGYLDEARSEHTDVYHLFGGRVQVFTTLTVRHYNVPGPQVHEPTNVETYETLQQRLPREEDELDIPVYAFLKEHAKQQKYVQNFQKHFEAVVHELRQVETHQKQGEGENQAYETPAYLVELLQAVSAFTEEELKQTMPAVVRQQQPKQLSEEDHLRRQLWIELLGKAGSKAAVKVVVEFVKNHTFTPAETRRVFQDVAAFLSFPDTEVVEHLLDVCTNGQGYTLTATGKATACVAAGKAVAKACNSKVYQWAQTNEYKKKFGGKTAVHTTTTYEVEPEAEEYRHTYGHFPVKRELVCTPEKLQHYVERLHQALKQSTDFKDVVAYINGLAKVQKPEVLPRLLEYVNGTAENLKHLTEQGEEEHEVVDFVRRVALVSLKYVAEKYPKEVNPIARVVFLNTTETVQTRLVAFDVWINTQPAQWEVEKVMQTANKDSSLELTHYVYSTFKTVLTAQEPCYRLLAQRVQTAWTQIRPFDFGFEFSHVFSRSYYNPAENFGVRGLWRVHATNTSFVPAFYESNFEEVHGPYTKTLFGVKLLVKGGEKFWQQLVGKNGVLENISRVFNNQHTPRHQETERLVKDITQGMNMKDLHQETPKAVLYWRAFAGETILPVDAAYLKELQQELFQTVTKFSQQGATGHYFRFFVPTKVYHVEPTTVGFPVVHSTVHPVVVSVRYENVKFNFGHEQGRVVPNTFEVTGTFHPVVLSYRQARVFLGEKEGHETPTVRVTDIKEFNTRFTFRVGYEKPEHRFYAHVKPVFDRVFHSGHCTEMKLEPSTLVDEHVHATVNYHRCVKTLFRPIVRNEQLTAPWTGMTLRVTGESHQPWAGLSIIGSQDYKRHGFYGALINRLLNKEMKHEATSYYLEADKQQPINEWVAIVDADSNIEKLAMIPTTEQVKKVHNIKAEYMTRKQPINGELKQTVEKMEKLLEKRNPIQEREETPIEKQMLVKIEGRYQGQPKRTFHIAMKRMYTADNTEQHFALAAEHKETKQGVEIYGNLTYPKITSPFRYDPTYFAEDERLNGTLTAKLTGQAEQIYRVNFEAVKSEEQKKESEYEWFETRCLAEQKAGWTMTDACRKALEKHNSLDAMRMTIELPRNMHPMVKAAAYKALDMIKYKYYPNMETEIAGRNTAHLMKAGQTGETQLRLTANATRDSAWTLLYNVRVETPVENVTFSQVRVPGLRPVHMQLTNMEQVHNMLTRNHGANFCVVGEKFVHTYDNVTFPLDVKTGCEYVLTRDHTEGETNFTVTFAVVRPETFAKTVRVQFYGNVVEFRPFTTTDRHFTVVFNNREHQVTFGKPFVFTYGDNRRVFVRAVETGHDHHNNMLVFETVDTKEFELYYDSFNVYTHVGYRYRGQVNGVCGNYDHEQQHEFVGPNGHEYEHSNEFVASYGVGSGCTTPVEKSHDQLMAVFNNEMEQIRLAEIIKKDKLRKQMHEQNPRQQTANAAEKQLNEFWMQQQEEQFWGNNQQQMPTEEAMATRPIEAAWNNQEERQMLKTAVSIENGHICFSSKPLLACKPGYKSEGVLRTERVASVCLERNNEAAIAALQQVRRDEIVNVAALERFQKGRLFTIHNVPKCERQE